MDEEDSEKAESLVETLETVILGGTFVKSLGRPASEDDSESLDFLATLGEGSW